MCVFNDGGTRLQREDPSWLQSEPWALKPDIDNTWAVLKLHEPNLSAVWAGGAQSPFLKQLYKLLPGRVILVMSADDLRRNDAAVSRSLSWERSVRDLVELIEKTPAVETDMMRHVVITFDYDAALYLRTSVSNGNTCVQKAILVFSTNRSEGEYQSGFEGSMPGAQTVFTSVVAGLIHAHFAADPSPPPNEATDGPLHGEDTLIEKILTYALIAKQQMLRFGFESVTDNNMFTSIGQKIGKQTIRRLLPNLMYHEAVFALPNFERKVDKRKRLKHDMVRPTALSPSATKPDRFCYPLGREENSREVEQLRKDQRTYKLSGVALEKEWLEMRGCEIFDVFAEKLGMQAFVDYVWRGKVEHDNATLALPIATIGDIKTISSVEIESLRAIRRVMQSYLAESNTSHTPLGLAVFGPPGSGKSFTVKSVFKTLSGASKKLIEGSFIECNLSGLSGPEEISHVFQRARDFRLKGKVPVMFFDEFDCSVGASEFFWLKHFLAPLQDGEFTSGQMTHPIGKSIFVFAGGVTPSFERFVDESRRDDSKPDTRKGRDFLSRLQGHIDVEGLWPIGPDGKPVADPGGSLLSSSDFRKCVMRRAILLREILNQRAHRIFKSVDGAEVANIDERIVKAFLRESEYRHGIRSIEAVIRMSSVDLGPRFTPECLPTRRQIEMHVSPRFYQRAFGLEAVE